MAVQWKPSFRPSPYSITPSPRGSSNSITSPTSGVPPTGTGSKSPYDADGVTG
jgi:hypothetical protein